jgi:hypothetical protein
MMQISSLGLDLRLNSVGSGRAGSSCDSLASLTNFSLGGISHPTAI